MRLILRTGIDLLHIPRFESVYRRYGMRFVQRIYTLREQQHCDARMDSYASRWAAKEAAAKMLGVGLRGLGSGAPALPWTTIEVLHDESRKPVLFLHGAARDRANALGIDTVDMSVSHDAGYVIVSVVGAGFVNDRSEA